MALYPRACTLQIAIFNKDGDRVGRREGGDSSNLSPTSYGKGWYYKHPPPGRV